MPVDEARAQFETMVFAPADLIRIVLPAMLERGQGRIINVGSAAVHTSTPLSGWYSAAKAALREVGDALRLELRGTGVDVIDLEPGGFATGIWDGADGELRRHGRVSAQKPLYDRVIARLPLGRLLMGDPEDVGRAVVDLLTVGAPPRRIAGSGRARRC